MDYELEPGTQISDLPYLDIFGAEYERDPVAYLSAARKTSWIYRSDRGVEVLAYEPVAALLRDRRFEMDHATSAQEAGVTDPDVMRFRTDFLVNTSGTTHTRLRASVGSYFSKGYAEELRPAIRAIIDELLDDVSARGGKSDLYDRVCQWVPALTYGLMIRASKEDAPFISRASDDILKILQPGARQDIELIESAYRELFDYIERRFAEAEMNPGEDLLTQLVRAQESGTISRREALDLAVLTLEASTDNTAHEMGLVAHTLLKNRDAWQKIVDDPSVIPTAIDEAIRVAPRIVWCERCALDEVEWRGLVVPKGTRFALSVIASSRDDSAFTDPDVFDLTRQNPKPSLMFGGGMTVCLGQHIARVEMQEFIDALVTRYPHLRLSDDAGVSIGTDVTSCDHLWAEIPQPSVAASSAAL